MPDDTLKIAKLFQLVSGSIKSSKTDSALIYNKELIALILKLKQYSKLADAYNDQHNIYRKSGNNSLAEKALLESLKNCRNLKFRQGISASYRNLAIYLFSKGSYLEAIENAQLGLQYGDSIADPLKYMSLLNNIGTCNSNLGNYRESAGYLLRALRISESIKDTFRIAAICNNISQLYNRMEDYNKSKEYAFKSISWLKEYDSLSLKNPYTNIAYIYLEHENKLDSALYFYRKAAMLSLNAGDITLLSKTYQNIASVYKKTGEIDSAKVYIDLALKSGIESSSDENIAGALNMKGILLMEEGDRTGSKEKLKEALSYFNKSLGHSQASESISMLQSTYQNLSIIYSKMGEYKSAYDYNLKYTAIMDSLLSLEIVNNTNKLESLYQTEKRDKEIAENKIKLQQQDLEIARKSTTNTLLMAGIGLLIVLIISGMVVFRQRQKLIQRNKDLERHKAIEHTRAAIANDLHDDIGSTLSSVQFMSSFAIKALDKSPSESKAWMEKIEENTGRVISDIRDIVWTLNPANDNANEIILRMRHFCSQMLEPENIILDFQISNSAIAYIEKMIGKRNLFLIFKEAVNNAARYSEAKQITIHLTETNGLFKMIITDNGKGFDQRQVSSGNGLKNMNKRAEALGGKLILFSDASGTRIEFTV